MNTSTTTTIRREIGMLTVCRGENQRVTHFGTSAKYLSELEQSNVQPSMIFFKPHPSSNYRVNLVSEGKYQMEKLLAVYSTGSVLAPSTFEYVYREFGPDINLGSITGGTDIISLFGAPSPLSPVYSGEIQCLGLGMKVEVWDGDGSKIENSGEPGDLVCVKPFPCMPVKFWGDGGEAAYKKSYFEKFPGGALLPPLHFEKAGMY